MTTPTGAATQTGQAGTPPTANPQGSPTGGAPSGDGGSAGGGAERAQNGSQGSTGSSSTPQDSSTADSGTEGQETRQPNDSLQSMRTRAQDAEKERDTLRGRLEAYENDEVYRVACDHLADGNDLFAHFTLDELRGEDGNISREAVESACKELVMHKPHYSRTVRRGDRTQNVGGEGTQPQGPKKLSEALSDWRDTYTPEPGPRDS